MKFQELRQIEDLKEKLTNLNGAYQKIRMKLDGILQGKTQFLIQKTVADFSRFFSDQGFEITSDDVSGIAKYKSIKISLKLAEPGRREEDIEALVKFLFKIEGPVEDVFTVHIQSGQPENRPVVSAVGDSTLAPELLTIADGLKTLLQTIQDEITAADYAGNTFKIEENKAVIRVVGEDFRVYKNIVQGDLELCGQLHRNIFRYIICHDKDEWGNNICQQHPSFIHFLMKLNGDS